MATVNDAELRELANAADLVGKVRRDLEGAEERVRKYRAQLRHAETQLDNAIRRIVADNA